MIDLARLDLTDHTIAGEVLQLLEVVETGRLGICSRGYWGL
jgi:hypothetical protein